MSRREQELLERGRREELRERVRMLELRIEDAIGDYSLATNKYLVDGDLLKINLERAELAHQDLVRYHAELKRAKAQLDELGG